MAEVFEQLNRNREHFFIIHFHNQRTFTNRKGDHIEKRFTITLFTLFISLLVACGDDSEESNAESGSEESSSEENGSEEDLKTSPLIRFLLDLSLREIRKKSSLLQNR